MDQSLSWEATSRLAAKKLPVFYGNRKLTDLCTRARRFSQSWNTIILVLIISSHLRLFFLVGLYLSDFETKTLLAFLFCIIIMHSTCPAHLIHHNWIILIFFAEYKAHYCAVLCILLLLTTLPALLGPFQCSVQKRTWKCMRTNSV